MAVQADAVPGAMRQAGQLVAGAPAFLLVVGADGVVDGADLGSELRRGQRDFLAGLHRVPDLALPGRGLAHDPGPGDVRLVAMHRAAHVHEDHGAFAQGLLLLRAVRIGAGLIDQHQAELRRAAQRGGGGGHHLADLARRHAGADIGVDVLQRRQGDVVGALHQGQFRGRLDQPHALDQGVARDRAIGAGAGLAHPVDDEQAGGGLEGDVAAHDAAVPQRADHPGEGAFVLVPGPDVGGDLQGLADRWLLEGRGDDHRVALHRDHRRRGAFRPPPLDAGEIFEAGPGLHHQGAEAPVRHRLLQGGDAFAAFLRGDRLRPRGHGLQLADTRGEGRA